MFRITKAQVADPYFITKALSCHEGIDREYISELIYKERCAFTFWYKDRAVGIIGASLINKKVAYGWSYLSEEINTCKKSFAKGLRDFIDDYFEVMKLNRFFVAVACDNLKAIRQNEWMGLTREGIMRKSGINGEDQVILARVRE